MRWSASGSRIAWLVIRYLLPRIWVDGSNAQLDGGGLLQHCVEVPEYAELAQDHRSRRVTVEQLDPPVLETKDIAAWRVHLVARRRKDPLREPERSVVSSLQCQLDDHHVATHVHVVELAMHVGERCPVIFGRLSNFAGPAVRQPNRFVDEHSVQVEAVDPRREVLDLGCGVCLADELFVCHAVPFCLSLSNS